MWRGVLTLDAWLPSLEDRRAVADFFRGLVESCDKEARLVMTHWIKFSAKDSKWIMWTMKREEQLRRHVKQKAIFTSRWQRMRSKSGKDSWPCIGTYLVASGFLVVGSRIFLRLASADGAAARSGRASQGNSCRHVDLLSQVTVESVAPQDNQMYAASHFDDDQC